MDEAPCLKRGTPTWSDKELVALVTNMHAKRLNRAIQTFV